MFKKSLAALAVLGAAAGYASAADVTLFGVVDTGLIYTHQTFADDSKADVNTPWTPASPPPPASA